MIRLRIWMERIRLRHLRISLFPQKDDFDGSYRSRCRSIAILCSTLLSKIQIGTGRRCHFRLVEVALQQR